MSEQLNYGLQNLDDFLRNTLNNHQAELSPDLWGKMKLKLFKNDVSEFVRFKKLKKSFHPQCKSVSLQLKIWTSYAVAASLTIGFVFGSTYYISNLISKPETKTEKNIKPAQLKPLQSELNKSIIDPRQTSEISNLPVVSNDNDNLPIKHDKPLVVNNNIPNNNNTTNIASNTIPKENTIPAASKNFNTLINYIQRLNPQDKIATLDKTDQTVEDAEIVENNNFPVSNNAQENIIQTPVYEIEIPNVITPNGDGFNDVLVIKNLDKYTDNNLLIADRAGKIVYEKNAYQNDWDAQNIPDGTYYYILSYKNKSNSKGVIKGLITIIRK
jgi:gliding motility-associated-like protein